MKITHVDTLHCDAGWRPWTFIKISTDEGIVGYSECTDSHGSPRGIEGCVRDFEPLVIGQDPRRTEKIFWDLYRATRQSPGGVIQKAIGGIENALLDIKAKALGVPVYELFGGPLRERIPLYWSHCGTTRLRAWRHVGTPPLRTLDDMVELGREVVQRGFTALKTNILILGDAPTVWMPGFGGGEGTTIGSPERPKGVLSESEGRSERTTDQHVTPQILEALESLFGALRRAVGPRVEIALDLNFNVKPSGAMQVAKVLEPFNLAWLEFDCYDPDALLQVKASTRTPICSGENLYTSRAYRPFFERRALDIAMIDVPWNGLVQSKKIADLAELYELNVAPHNYYSHLATLISAHFCAVVPNLRILEVDVDDVSWKDELVTRPPAIQDGQLAISSAPGWGADLNEDVLKAHPWPSHRRAEAPGRLREPEVAR